MAVTLTKGRHVRLIGGKPATDATPVATCHCLSTMRGRCPVHNPDTYADCMARYSDNYPGQTFGRSYR